jgi:hypothetical protein
VFSQGKLQELLLTDKAHYLVTINFTIKGTKTGVSADFDGKFSINTTVNSGELVISFIGFQLKMLNFQLLGATKI